MTSAKGLWMREALERIDPEHLEPPVIGRRPGGREESGGRSRLAETALPPARATGNIMPTQRILEIRALIAVAAFERRNLAPSNGETAATRGLVRDCVYVATQ